MSIVTKTKEYSGKKMRENVSTVTTYAASAALAAATLVYVFGPTLYPNSDAPTSPKSGVVGLSNYSNDCYINSVLQAIAGLELFETSLARHCQRLEHENSRSDSDRQDTAEELGVSVARALQTMLSSLVETPVHAKTISAKPFIRSLEHAFGAVISRRQQDAHEMLQILMERVCEEYQKRSSQSKDLSNVGSASSTELVNDGLAARILTTSETIDERQDSSSLQSPNQNRFPFEGQLSSQIECLTCHHKPDAANSSFVTLSLNVPQKSTSLDECLDGMLKQELIEDYKCYFCRLTFLIKSKENELLRDTSPERKAVLDGNLQSLHEIQAHPSSEALEKVTFPESLPAPMRRISRHTRITEYPDILSFHLSRSVFNSNYSSQKNKAKMKFQEFLSLGVFDRRIYRLSAMITHLGGHNSGHYEAFRRQDARHHSDTLATAPDSKSDPQADHELLSKDAEDRQPMQRGSRKDHKKERTNKWWRISDDKVRDSTTKNVLEMQEQVYLLFYELQSATEYSSLS